MKYVILACLNTRIEVFMPPQAVNDMLDEDIIESNRRAVVAGTIPADKAKNLIVYKLGTFDDSTGILEAFKEPVKLVNLNDFVPRKELFVEEAKIDGKNVSTN